MPHAALAARQRENGAEDWPDARRPANREGQPHGEGADEARRLAADLELAGASEHAPLQHPGDIEAEEDNPDAAADPDPVAVLEEEVARGAEGSPEAHEDSGESGDECERVQEDPRALGHRDL